MSALRVLIVLGSLLPVLAGVAKAAPIGAIAEVDGSAEIGRGGVWSGATIAATVEAKDELRTGPRGRLLLVLGDSSILVLGYDSQLAVESHDVDPVKGTVRTLLRLLKGKARAVVSEDYKRPGSSHEIETPTAVTSVRGTEFVILYDPVADVSEVVGVDDEVDVFSVLAWTTGGVSVTPRQMTRVERGGYPSTPRQVPEDLFRQYLEGLQFVGYGRPESLTIGFPLLIAGDVPPPDRPDQFAPPPGSRLPKFSCLEPLCGRGSKGDVPVPTGPLTGGGAFQPLPGGRPVPGGLDIQF